MYKWKDYDRNTWPPSKWERNPTWQHELIRASSMISEEYKFIFVHIGRTGGHSMAREIFENKLAAVNSPNFDRPIYEFDDYFKFTIVRNPWDKMVSAYHLPNTWFNRRPNHPLKNNLPKDVTFSYFIKNILWDENGDPCNHHWVEQYKFIKDFRTESSDDIWVDFVGRFEDISVAWGKIQSEIGIDFELPRSNVNTNKPKVSYRDYYDDETKELVENKFRQDIEIFNYEF